MQLPLSYGFGLEAIGRIEILDKTLPQTVLDNMHEFFIAPAYQKDENGKWIVQEYSLIHRSALPTVEYLEGLEK